MNPECTCPPAYLRREGAHRHGCEARIDLPEGWTQQHRAVFSYPPSILGKTPDTYGPWRATLTEAAKDRVPRSEETLGWRSGFETRRASPIAAEKVYIEIDSVPFMGDPRATEGDKAMASELHGLWLDVEDLHEAIPGTRGRFTLQRTGQIVYREPDLAPAEVVTLRADWNRR